SRLPALAGQQGMARTGKAAAGTSYRAVVAPGDRILSDTPLYPNGLADVEGFKQPLEIRALETEGLGCRRVIALRLSQGSEDDLAAIGLDSGMIRHAGGGGRRRGGHQAGGQILERDLGPLAQDDRPLDDILQLANVARPVIDEEAGLCFWGDRR